jgi:hypothetical protein
MTVAMSLIFLKMNVPNPLSVEGMVVTLKVSALRMSTIRIPLTMACGLFAYGAALDMQLTSQIVEA